MPVVQMTRLGAPGMGRWGNQLLCAAGVHAYARKWRAEAQLPPWAGDALFGRKAAPLGPKLPDYHERFVSGHPSRPQQLNPSVSPKGSEAVDRDYVGWWQFHTGWHDPAFFRSLFYPLPEVRARFTGALKRLLLRGETLVGLHLRRGDYGQMIFYITPVEWYLELLADLWPTLANPVLFIATEDPALVEPFAKFGPVTARDLGVDLKAEPLHGYNYLDRDLKTKDPVQLDFYPDFYLLSKCDVIIAPNSTFSFAAAMLNPNLQAMYRSSLPLRGFERIDPWAAYPLTHDHVDDYPDIPGIRLADNPYWRR